MIRQRKMNLQLQLVDVADANLDLPFIFGERDCHTLTLEILDRAFNANGLQLAYKKYKTPKGAMRYQKRLGIDIKEFLMRYAAPIEYSQLAPCDVVLSVNEQYQIYNVYWYLGNSRFLIADDQAEFIRIEHHVMDNFKQEHGFECLRFTDDALNMLIEPYVKDENTDQNLDSKEE